MDNTGLLIREIQPTEWVLGGETGIAPANIKNWKPYLPKSERQDRINPDGTLVFNTMACTHFASGHIYETFIIYLWKSNQLSPEAIKFFTQFLTDPNDINSFRVSKQFSAIVGNNTPTGNYFTVAWDTWRKIGAIPDSMLNTLNTSKSWQEYHDKSHITPDMMAMAAQSLKYVTVMYQWLNFDGLKGFSDSETAQIQQALLTSPVNAGIPIPANHSTELFDLQNGTWGLFNTYEPFVTEASYDVNFALQAVVKPAVSKIPIPDHIFLKDLEFGNRGVEVYNLQLVLAYEGFLNRNLINQDPAKAYFGTNTKAALKKFQGNYSDFILLPAGLKTGTGYFGEWSRAFINSKYGHPSY